MGKTGRFPSHLDRILCSLIFVNQRYFLLTKHITLYIKKETIKNIPVVNGTRVSGIYNHSFFHILSLEGLFCFERHADDVTAD